MIAHNIPALSAHRALGQNNGNISKNLEKLSSGYKVNRAADDAAGLAISEKMRGQLRGFTMAERNVSNGIDLIKTAEGGLNETHAMLQRMRELAVQASNGTYQNGDRTQLELEYQAVKSEIDRVAESTHYNGIHLLDGSLSAQGVTVATGAGGSGGGTFIYGSGDGIPATQVPEGSAINWSAAGGKDYSALVSEMTGSIVPQVVNKLLQTLPSFQYFADSTLEVGLDWARNQTYGAQYEFSLSYGPDPSHNNLWLTLRLNLDYVDTVWQNGSFNSEAARSEFEQLIAHEFMHLAMSAATSKGMSGSPTAYPTWFKEGMAQAVGGDMGWVQLTASATDAQIQQVLTKSTLTANNTRSHYESGYLAVLYLAHMANGGGSVSGFSLAGGIDKIMGELAGGKSLDNVIADNTKYTGLQDFENNLGSDREAYAFVRELLGATGTGGGSILSMDLTDTDLVGNGPDSNTFLKLNPDGTVIKNEYPAGYSPGNGGDSYTTGSPVNSGYTPGVPHTPHPPRPTDPNNPDPGSNTQRRGPLVLQIGANGTADQRLQVFVSNMGSRFIGLLTDGVLTVSVSGTTIHTRDSANDAISVLEGAIIMVSSQRAQLGAVQNRLEHVQNSLGVTRENLTAAESTIRDTDMAKEMMGYTKNSILIQAAQSMLAQANQLPQGLLSLLR